ncbi:MAG: zinc-binding dehydrogenase [Micrococcaceae bacterium]|nr:zinc-binding dehydrogenase [Micrococcaceae bacterium]
MNTAGGMQMSTALVFNDDGGPETQELGGAGIQRTPEALEKITDVIKYGLVDPHVRARFSLADAQKAVAAVESGHLAGKVVVEP